MLRLPKARFTLRLAMVAIAIQAVGLAVLVRPYPISIEAIRGAPVIVRWSDGTTTIHDGSPSIANPPHIVASRLYGPLIWLRFEDGSQAWRLHRNRP